MEALSVAASGIAVVSLALQLIQSIAAIRAFVGDVKDAPKELERLVDKLEQLETLLEEARKILEQQSSLQGLPFPAPSVAIFKCLQGCEKSLQPLLDIVKKFTAPSESKMGSTAAKLKREMKLGMKAKDIAAFEARIQQNVDLLSTTLVMNTNTILMSLAPAILQTQQEIRKNKSALPKSFQSSSSAVPTATTSDTIASPTSSPIRYSQQTLHVQSSLERFGVYRRKVIRYRYLGPDELSGNTKSRRKETVFEADELSLMWKMIGFGLTLTQKYSYGGLFPSLTTYPVGEFSEATLDVIDRGSVRDLQDMFSSGAVHPFLRAPNGWSLLHFAALNHRSDLCRLLLDCGVESDVSPGRISPLTVALIQGATRLHSPGRIINTYRCLVDDSDLVREINMLPLGPRGFAMVESQFLWEKSTELLMGEDLQNTRRTIMQYAWQKLAYSGMNFPKIPMDTTTLWNIQSGHWRLMHVMFNECIQTHFGYTVGARYLEWLVELGLDPETCIAEEIAYIEGGEPLNGKRIVFERNNEQGWILGFEHSFDCQMPTYDFMSEYTTLIVENRWSTRWPELEWKVYCHHNDNRDRYNSRFIRRIAAKERKERARLGQKRLRSKMPGSWIP